MINIATILTCFNRREKTIFSLQHLFASMDYYNSIAKEPLQISVYITDDRCTDGTAEAVTSAFPDKDIHITRSEGDLFWARGMNMSWKIAAEAGKWNYFLLLNDDTNMKKECFVDLFDTQKYSMEHHGKEALVSGIIASKENHDEVTYGGEILLTKFTAKLQRLEPTGKPQKCDMTNANILLVPKSLFERIGFFYPYTHSCADSDYSVMARRAGFPVYVTSEICGYCDFDHWTKADDREKIVKMTLKERKAYFNHPLHSNKDYLTMIRRIMPWRYPFVWFFRNMVVYAPGLYYRITYRRYEK
ncbi:MAG: glycosyltransferase family 2 protein [Prevotella sp.]|nr:glycosyltransferase family 2 protein [Candidatus Prevotella equi]